MVKTLVNQEEWGLMLKTFLATKPDQRSISAWARRLLLDHCSRERIEP